MVVALPYQRTYRPEIRSQRLLRSFLLDRSEPPRISEFRYVYLLTLTSHLPGLTMRRSHPWHHGRYSGAAVRLQNLIQTKCCIASQSPQVNVQLKHQSRPIQSPPCHQGGDYLLGGFGPRLLSELPPSATRGTRLVGVYSPPGIKW